MSYLFYGGIFTSPTEVETVRAASYKFYKLDPVRKRNQLPRVMLMTRANVAGNLPGRMIGNKDELSLYLRRGREWIYSEDAMELLDPRTQAQRMVASAGGKLQEPVFDDAVTLCWAIPAGQETPLCHALAELTRGAAAVEVSPPEHAPF